MRLDLRSHKGEQSKGTPFLSTPSPFLRHVHPFFQVRPGQEHPSPVVHQDPPDGVHPCSRRQPPGSGRSRNRRDSWVRLSPCPLDWACDLTFFLVLCSLGYEAALHFARLNISTLIFAVRNPKKAETAERQLYKDVPSFRGQVKVIKLDYDSFESVRSFVREVDSSFDRLDFALLNAGVTNQTYQATPDGWVQDIQVNVLSTGLLAALLLPKLSATAKLPLPEKASHPDFKPQLHIVSSEGAFARQMSVLELADSFLRPVSPLLGRRENYQAVDQRKAPPRPPQFVRFLQQPALRRDVQHHQAPGRLHRPQDRCAGRCRRCPGHLFLAWFVQVGIQGRLWRICCLVRLLPSNCSPCRLLADGSSLSPPTGS